MRPRERTKTDSARSSFSGNQRRGTGGNGDGYSRRKKDDLSGQRRTSQGRRRGKEYEAFSKESSMDNENRRQASRSRRGPKDFEKGPNNQKVSRQNRPSFPYRRGYESRINSNGNREINEQLNRSSSQQLYRNNEFRENADDMPSQNDSREDENHEKDIFWGRHATQAILESGRPLHRIWCTAELRTSPRFLQLLREAKSLGVLVEEVSWSRLGHLTNGGVHQGIALQTAASETLDLATLIDGCHSLEENPVLLALDGLTDPHNLGAIVRSAEALGAHGLVLPQRRSAGLTGSVAKVAAGALEHLPVARVVNLNRSLEALKKAGYTVIGLAEEGSKTLNQLDVEGPLVVVIGSEGKGISLVTRRYCDQLMRIPLRGVTSSLNASVATSIFLYEVAKKSWMSGISGNAPSPKLIRAKVSLKD